MKVRMTIEFEMNHSVSDEPETKMSKQELISGLIIRNSDEIDGFELTTNFCGYDNSSDFFIVPDSHKIISAKCIDKSIKNMDYER